MDPSIMKLLEDDEDESMHSGAEVEALSAALNRDIGGDAGTITSTSEPGAGLLAAGSSSASQQILKDWQISSQEENNMKIQQKEEKPNLESTEQQHSSQGDFNQPGAGVETQDKQVGNQQAHAHLSLQVDNQQQQSEKVNLFESADKEKGGKLEDPAQGGNTSKQDIVQHPVQYNQQAPPANEVDAATRKMKPTPSIPFHMLIPILRPHLDKDRSMQLQAVFTKLRNNEVSKEDFLRVIRNIVGDQMLRQAAHKVQIQLHAQTTRSAQANPSQYPLQTQASSSQQIASGGASQITESQSLLPLNSSSSQKGANQPYNPASIIQMRVSTSSSALENTGPNSRESDNKLDAKGVHQHNYPANMSLQGINKQQHLTQLPQPSFSMYGSTTNFNPHAYPRPSITSTATLRPTNQASTQMKPFQSLNVMNMPKQDVQNTSIETKRLYTGPVSSHSTSQNTVPGQISATKEQKNNSFPSMPYVKQEVVDQTTEPPNKLQTTAKDDSSFSSVHLNQGSSTLGMVKNDIVEKQPSKFGASSTSSVGTAHISAPMASQLDQSAQVPSVAPHRGGVAAKTPVKKTSIGQKKPLEAPGSSPPSKKQKTSATFLDQSIEQLNDVTAVSGVNLREEEEQLLSAPKEESRASEATRRVVQEEEERLLLLEGPLQRKMEAIMSKCGVASMSNDVMRCLSMCVEECLRGLITRLIRLSKQRVDMERTRHRYVITSDVQRQILAVNMKAKEEWDKKQAEEAEKLRKPNETEGSTNVDVDKDKEEGRTKNLKVNKEEDDKMRTTAANVAARAAFGGDDMLSKWQLMAEQARQKREGHDGASSSQGKGPSGKAATFGRSSGEEQESEKKGHSTSVSGGRKFGRSAVTTHPKVARTISLKDVIALLEREPQMSKSRLLYRLYDKLPGDSSAE